MADEKHSFDYNLILADLEAKKTALEAAIASLRMAAASGALTGIASSSANPASVAVPYAPHGSAGTSGYSGYVAPEVPSGAFLGKSVREATILYLSLIKRNQTTREIAAALQAGGMESTSKNFTEMVGTVLYQIMKKAGGAILRIGDAWGLAEWYPAGFRSSNQEPNKGKKKRIRRVINKATVRRVIEQTAPGLKTPGPQDRIATLLWESPDKQFGVSEIASELKIHPKAAVLFLGKLEKKKSVKKIMLGGHPQYQGVPTEEGH